MWVCLIFLSQARHCSKLLTQIDVILEFIEEHLVIGFKQIEDIDIRWVVLFQNVIKDFANRGIRIRKVGFNVVWIGFVRH